jgi:transposase InsO family protein
MPGVGTAPLIRCRTFSAAQTNGKAERFIQTLLREWAYGHLYRSNAERLERLPGWVREYNTERTHTSLGDITPMEALVNNLRGNHS